MIFSKNNPPVDSSGTAALALVKVLLDVLERKQVLSKEEIDILLNCAEVEVDSTDTGTSASEAKFLIHNLMKVSDDTTRGYDGATN